MRSNRRLELLIASAGLLVLIVLGIVVPSVRAGGFEVNVPIAIGSVVVPALLLALIGSRNNRG
ncbi:hypothetical protein [Saccharothrix hoggarensis]|uniref:DUF3098 domain-containing protein n=1 Tax=Saccharothrix hoggarensis TaxID=913853 RepID=A0ABW3QZ84_9PSEU